MTTGIIIVIALALWVLLSWWEQLWCPHTRPTRPAPEPRRWRDDLPRPGHIVEGMGVSPAPALPPVHPVALDDTLVMVTADLRWPHPPPVPEDADPSGSHPLPIWPAWEPLDLPATTSVPRLAIDTTSTTVEAPLPALTTGGGR